MKQIWIVGTCDTKHDEMLYVRDQLSALGISASIIDIGIFNKTSSNIPCEKTRLADLKLEIFRDINDRGKAVSEMGLLLEEYIKAHAEEIDGIIGLGGSGNTAIATKGMRALPVGIPKIMVSTVASGDVEPYVGATDIIMFPSVADVQGLNVITRKILGNAANALGGMVLNPVRENGNQKELIGLSMFGVTTPAVQQICGLLPKKYEPLVFHATGTGGKALEKLIDSGIIKLVIDVTLTEICDLFMGGVMSAGEDRLGAVIRTKVPYIGSLGALDMVNFAALPTVPEKYRKRNLYVHNENVTLMRTTKKENAEMGLWIAKKLNQCDGPVRFIIPEGGVSAIDAPGMPFYDPDADNALYSAIMDNVKQTENRKVIQVPYHINDLEFARIIIENLKEIAG